MDRVNLGWETSPNVAQHAPGEGGWPLRMPEAAAPPDPSAGARQDEGRPAAGALKWQTPPELYRAALSASYDMAFNPLNSNGVVVFDAPVRRVLDAFKTPCAPDELPALIPGIDPHGAEQMAQQLVAAGLLVPLTGARQPANPPEQIMNVWLHITDACNLKCTYCYLNKTGERMDESTGRAAVRAAFRTATQHGFRAIKFKYGGGEPTLNFPLLLSLHHQVQQLAAQHHIRAREVMLTNAVGLTGTMVDALREGDIELMVSLDGLGAAHDEHRRLGNGQGTFELVMGSIMRAIAGGVLPQLMITVSGRNMADLPGVVEFALEHDLLFRFNFYREVDRCTPEVDLKADHARLIEGLRAAMSVIETRLPQRRVIDGLLDRSVFGYAHDRCCAVDYAYLVVDPKDCGRR